MNDVEWPPDISKIRMVLMLRFIVPRHGVYGCVRRHDERELVSAQFVLAAHSALKSEHAENVVPTYIFDLHIVAVPPTTAKCLEQSCGIDQPGRLCLH